MPENIFISYARADGEDHARKFHQDLKALEHGAWFDKDPDDGILAGEHWAESIETGIDNCTVFLLLMTPKSIISPNCAAEWSRALNKKKKIIPIRLTPTDGEAPVEFDQLPLYIAPIQFIDFVDDFAVGWTQLTYRLEQLGASEFEAEQDKARKIHTSISIAVSSYLLTTPDSVPRLPDVLIGRDNLKQQIEAYIQQKTVSVLYGIGGVGKSALVAQVIADKLHQDKQAVLWLEVGNAPIDAVFDKIGQAFEQQKAMIDADSQNDKIQLTQKLIQAYHISAIVIDDAWNPATLATLMKAIPRKYDPIPVIVTSRQRQQHITGGEVLAVDELSADDARTLLLHYAGDLPSSEGADRLCEMLYYHPFLLEIASRTLNQRDVSPQRLADDIENQDITQINMPAGLVEEGRENMAKLIQQSLSALPDDFTRTVFLTFGHLPTATATPELLALLLYKNVDYLKQWAYLSEAFGQDQRPIDLPDLPTIQTALDTLVKHGLLARIHAETREGYPYTVEYFRLHDLSHSYATAQHSDPVRMVTACLVYTFRHNTPAYDNFSALRTELDNLISASSTAMSQARWHTAERFAWNLHVQGGSRFTNLQGYYSDGITLLTQAAEATKQRGDKQAQGNHLGNLGLAYASLGQYQKAIEYYEQILVIHREIGDRQGEGNDLGNLGNAYASLGQYQKAIDYHEQALVISREIGDRGGEGADLGNLGIAYDSLGQYQKAIEYHEQALVIRREIGDRKGEGADLGNLGGAYLQLRQYQKAIEYCEQALVIRRAIGDRKGEGADLGNLAVAYKRLEEYEKAIDYYQQALDLGRSIGDRNGVAIDLYNLGLLYNDLERFGEALPLLKESLELVKAMGQTHKVENRESEIARARIGLLGG